MMKTEQEQLRIVLQGVAEGDLLRVMTSINPDRSIVRAGRWEGGVLKLNDQQYIEIRQAAGGGWVLVRDDGFCPIITAIIVIPDGQREEASAT